MSALLRGQARRGALGTLLIVGIVLASLNLSRLPLVGDAGTIEARFAEAGGLRGGDAVMISGAQVGKVREVRLEDGAVTAVLALTDDTVTLGNQTEAQIITTTLLGRAAVELVPEGDGALEEGDTIPVERTSSPYNITSALNQLTTESAEIDKQALQRALARTSAVLEGSQDSVGPALQGITEISRVLATNDERLAVLLDRSARVTAVLADRDQEIGSLLTAGESLFAELDARQRIIEELLRSARALSDQLRAALQENARVIGPALSQLNEIVDVLNRNRKAIQDTVTGLRGYATAFGDAASTGPWFDAYIQNLTDPATLAPVLSGILP